MGTCKDEVKWSREELLVIAKYAGKESPSFITDEVNKVSKVHRSQHAVTVAGNKRGYEFKIIK